MSQILVVDDSLTVRMGLAEALGNAGYVPVPCSTLAEARIALATRPIALAILDVRLPDGDGIDFLHELRASADRRTLPILVLSTEAEVSDRVRGMTQGANDYVGKPYETDFVLARVRQLAGPPPSSSRLVLAIDDSPTFRNALAERLASAGYEVATAASGTEGLRVAASRRPGAIVVDGVMPDMRGEVVVRRIRLDPILRTTPCLLLTGSHDAVAEISALDAGADAFARKDADIDVILARLSAIVQRTGENPVEGMVGPKRVLLVDSDGEYIKSLCQLLVDEAYDVVQAASGEQAIELLPVQPVDCIVLAMQLPGLGGAATCRRIKAAPALRDAALIALTSDDTREAMLGALAAGADDFVSKRAGNDVVAARVKAQIRRKKFADEHRAVRERLFQSERDAAEARAATQLAEARAAHADELAAANRELEAFSYSVSHDLRAPLRAIRSFAAMLEEDAGPKLDAAAHEHINRITSASARMSDLIDALLELSRISRAELARGRVDLGALAAAVIDDLRTRDPDRRVEIAIAPELEVEADPRLARSLLDNVIGNAWKFTANVAGRIEIGREPGAFFVRDNGAGFDMAHAGKLFTPFARLHTGEFAGTGIGLATVRRICERHHGRVWADSAVGRGTTIYFSLGT
ncbi:MAG TPA: response regulator [Kofleriaceae bacterium]